VADGHINEEVVHFPSTEGPQVHESFCFDCSELSDGGLPTDMCSRLGDHLAKVLCKLIVAFGAQGPTWAARSMIPIGIQNLSTQLAIVSGIPTSRTRTWLPWPRTCGAEPPLQDLQEDSMLQGCWRRQ
jgi:hypothetical protein